MDGNDRDRPGREVELKKYVTVGVTRVPSSKVIVEYLGVLVSGDFDLSQNL